MRITTAIAAGSNCLKEKAAGGGTFNKQNHDLKERFGAAWEGLRTALTACSSPA
jgi:hypothetical protein